MTQVGAAVTPKTGETWAQAIASFEQLTGRQMRVRRCFDTTPASSVSASQLRHDIGSRRKSILSMKPNMSTPLSTLNSFASDIVATNHTCDIIIYHEPVDNMSGPDFVALYRRSAAPFLDAGIPVGVCYTNWSATVLPYSNSRSALEHYWPGDEWADFIAIDEYPAGEISSTKDALPMDQRARRLVHFADNHEKPISLTEFGVDGTWDVLKAERWFRSVTDWALMREQQGLPLRDICYFHADVGGSFWLDNHPEYVQAYRDLYDLVGA